jgi:hypothetical protein
MAMIVGAKAATSKMPASQGAAWFDKLDIDGLQRRGVGIKPLHDPEPNLPLLSRRFRTVAFQRPT